MTTGRMPDGGSATPGDPPGALLARRLLWHKTSKRSFVTIFWLTVVANLAVVYALVLLYRKLIAA